MHIKNTDLLELIRYAIKTKHGLEARLKIHSNNQITRCFLTMKRPKGTPGVSLTDETTFESD